MLTGGQLVVPFRVRLLGRVRFLASPTCPIQCRINHWGDTVSLAFGHTMEIRLSCGLRSGVPPFAPYKACLLLVMVGVFIALLAWNCNVKGMFSRF